MESGVNNFKDLAEIISYCVTAISLLGLWATYIFSQKQIHFATMEKCVSNFKEITKWSGLQSDISPAYIEFVSEEFFYFENGYLPLEVSIEWIDGMIDYLPFYDKNKVFVKSNRLDSLKSQEQAIRLLRDYPRIRKAIQMHGEIDFEIAQISIENESDREKRKQKRDKIIYTVIINLNISWWRKINLKKIIANR
ncbi:hypothetical protein EV144_1011414 [Flavobacterium sp. 270]|uniref:hypothetical protein n=1 Tax=Flavobacterium sp. 270 TaxID=2512114 RepID=UPI0010667DC3|nr:hypothetical protein [Flavobacterium sp. 270]TDW52722.1 hypothetical protein EV144_1011414 [Flavobacterium sp. 270]